MADDVNKQRRARPASAKPAASAIPQRMKKIDVDKPFTDTAFQMKAPTDPPPDEGVRASGVVSPGHCVHVCTGKRLPAGTVAQQSSQNPAAPPTFATVWRAETKVAMPGETVEFSSVEERDFLIARGFLLNPDGSRSAARRENVATNGQMSAPLRAR